MTRESFSSDAFSGVDVPGSANLAKHGRASKTQIEKKKKLHVICLGNIIIK